jgi:SAM-dependent methyltransferase
MSVLEIGCGIGNTLYDVTERFHTHSVGIDLDAGLASRLPEQGSLTFEDCDIRELPEKFYNCFDAAFSYYTWHYIDDKLGALKNVHRALKIGGRALIDFGSLEVEDLGFQTRLYDPLMTPSLEEVINATDHRGQLSWERVNIFDVQGKQERRCCRVKIEKASDASIEFPSFEGIGSNLPGVKSAFKRSIYAG